MSHRFIFDSHIYRMSGQSNDMELLVDYTQFVTTYATQTLISPKTRRVSSMIRLVKHSDEAERELSWVKTVALLPRLANLARQQTAEIRFWQGLALKARAESLRWVNGRQQHLDVFLKLGAKASFKLPPSSRDKKMAGTLVSHTYSLLKAIQAGASTRRWSSVRERYQEIRTRSRQDLDHVHIAQWLQSHTGRKALFEFLAQDLQASMDYVRFKLDMYWTFSKARVLPVKELLLYATSGQTEEHKTLQTELQSYEHFLKGREIAHEACLTHFELIKNLGAQLKKISAYADTDLKGNSPAVMARLQELKRFSRYLNDYLTLSIHQGQGPSPEELIGKRLAIQLPHDIQWLKDGIFEVQLHASLISRKQGHPL